MLNEYIPIITRDEGGTGWKIEQAANPFGKDYPSIPERHLQPFKMGIGPKGGSVDSKGAFIEPPLTERATE